MGAASQQLWEVVGGAGKGGILARSGAELQSPQLQDRLSTGARVRQLDIQNGRLRFLLVEGTGPPTGWVSVALKGEPLVVRVGGAAADAEGAAAPDRLPPLAAPPDEPTWPRPSGLPPLVSAEAPQLRQLRDMRDEEFRALPRKTWPHPNYNRKQHPVMAAKDVPGKFFGLVFPYSLEKLREAGAAWLTTAFHTAGTLPRENAVASVDVVPLSVDPMEGEAIGGSSVKGLLHVEYATNSPGLHRTLFVKLPLVPTPESERVYNGKNWWLDEPEVLFNLIGQTCPFRVPKCYFSDFSPESTNFIHIWEGLDFEKEYVPSRPWVLAKPGLKNRDYELPNDGLERYLAFMRRLGHFSGATQTGKLGELGRLRELFEFADLLPWPTNAAERKERAAWMKMPENQQGVLARAQPAVGMAQMNCHTASQLILYVAPQLFPAKFRDAAVLKKLCTEVVHVQQYAEDISFYSSGMPELMSLSHQNTQLDNAVFFHTDEACTQWDCCILDWAAVRGGPPHPAIGANLIGGAEPRMLEGGGVEKCAAAWTQGYHEAGGSEKVTLDRVLSIIKLGMATGASGLMGFLRTIQNNVPFTDPRWKTFKDRWDPEINDNYVRRAAVAQMNHVLETWASPKVDLYGHFKRWLADNKDIIFERPAVDVEMPRKAPGSK